MMRTLFQSATNPRHLRNAFFVGLAFAVTFSLVFRGSSIQFEDLSISPMILYLFEFHTSILPILYLWFILSLYRDLLSAYWPRVLIAQGYSPHRLAGQVILLALLSIPIYFILTIGSDQIIALFLKPAWTHNLSLWDQTLYLLIEGLAHIALVLLILALAASFSNLILVLVLTHSILLINLPLILNPDSWLMAFFWLCPNQLELLLSTHRALIKPYLIAVVFQILLLGLWSWIALSRQLKQGRRPFRT